MYLIVLTLYSLLRWVVVILGVVAAGSNGVSRYWAVEHIALMIVALILIHVGRALSKRAKEGAAKHRWAAIFFILGMLAILFAIPWPFFPYGRPLIRLG